MLRRATFLFLLVFLAPSVARAEALLRLTPEGWSPSAYEAAGYPTDPAIIGPDGFRLTYHGGGADSQSYTNWSRASDLTSWNLFVYQLYFASAFGRGDFVEFGSSLSLPEGSYVVGYGLNAPGKNGTQAVQATPFTFAGRVAVPEPATMTLLIPALGLFALARRKFIV